ncbi:hypothetical protein SLOPH_686 [Spraguea lophii 42_110]|uniref:Uncharacterized protein n=1 Tax=Spraguea lophii (strain 42_110) TaxID=1358809 RepID=S7XKW1_SPRLO|nr:hypothetical protein SLOPH_686 [Spraguea lophii 42_110]
MFYEVISILNVSKRLEENIETDDKYLDINKVVLKCNNSYVTYFMDPVCFGVGSILSIKQIKKIMKKEDYEIVKQTEKKVQVEFINELIKIRNKKKYDERNMKL